MILPPGVIVVNFLSLLTFLVRCLEFALKLKKMETQTRHTISVHDEGTGRIIQLYLNKQDLEHAQRDSTYLKQLLEAFYTNEAQEIAVLEAEQPPSEIDLSLITEVDGNDHSGSGSNLFIWNESCIFLLLSLYEDFKEEFCSSRHKKVYDKIATKIKQTNPNYIVSGSQCQSKLNSLKKMYKKIVDHNATSGNDRATWPYFERMNELFGCTGWAHPVATASEAGPAHVASEEPKTTKRKLETILQESSTDKKKYREEKLKIQKENYDRLLDQREKHHREKMTLLQTIINRH